MKKTLIKTLTLSYILMTGLQAQPFTELLTPINELLTPINVSPELPTSLDGRLEKKKEPFAKTNADKLAKKSFYHETKIEEDVNNMKLHTINGILGLQFAHMAKTNPISAFTHKNAFGSFLGLGATYCGTLTAYNLGWTLFHHSKYNDISKKALSDLSNEEYEKFKKIKKSLLNKYQTTLDPIPSTKYMEKYNCLEKNYILGSPHFYENESHEKDRLIKTLIPA